MAFSLNGWQVPPFKLKTFDIPGTKRRVTLDADAGRILVAVAADYHRTVRPIDVGPWDEGGYNPRQARQAKAWSNHASGSAVDLNWSSRTRDYMHWEIKPGASRAKVNALAKSLGIDANGVRR